MSFIVSPPLPEAVGEITDSIRQQMASRAYRAANELRNAELDILNGQGGGRRYRLPHGKGFYSASAPGQPPARQSGRYRGSYEPSASASGDVFTSKIESDYQVGTKRKYVLGELLEGGTSKMAPRPHHDKIREKAEPGIVRIYSEPYF